MTADQRFTLTIAILTLIFLVLSALLGVMVRVVVKFTRAEDNISAIGEDLRELVEEKRREHHRFDERLTWLERQRPKPG